MEPSKPTMLVLAGDPRLNLAIEKVVERHGVAEVVAAWDPEQARALLEAIQFSVALIDCDLSRGRGQQLMAWLGMNKPEIRRVAMGRASHTELEQLIEAQLADAAVAKPIDASELRTACFPEREFDAEGVHHDARVPLSLGRRARMPSQEHFASPRLVANDGTPVPH